MIRRLKNLWAWSNIHPYESQKAMPAAKRAEPTGFMLNPDHVERITAAERDLAAKIIPYKTRDPIKEIVGEETAI